MKKICLTKLLCISLAAAVLFSGCGNAGTPGNTGDGASASAPGSAVSFDMQSLSDSVELPEYVTFAVEDGTASYPASAEVYPYVPFDFEAREQDIADMLSGGSAVRTESGVWECDSDGYSISIEIGKGTLRYSKNYVNGMGRDALEEIIDYTPALENSVDAQICCIEKERYAPDGELNGLPLADAKEAVMDIFAGLGLENVSIIRSYAMDAQTMNQRLEESLEASRDIVFKDDELFESTLGELLDLEFTEADECYMFILEMDIDGCGSLTGLSTSAMQSVDGIQMYCVYGREGLVNLRCDWIPDLSGADAESGGAVISPEEAMKIYVSEYAERTEREMSLKDIRFAYCLERDADKIVSAVPVWLFITEYEKTLEYTAVYNEYIAVNALTGEVI